MVDKKSKVFKKFKHTMNNNTVAQEVELLQKSEMPVIQMIHWGGLIFYKCFI